MYNTRDEEVHNVESVFLISCDFFFYKAFLTQFYFSVYIGLHSTSFLILYCYLDTPGTYAVWSEIQIRVGITRNPWVYQIYYALIHQL